MNPTLSDHRGVDIESWIDAYSGGDPVGKAEVFLAVSDALAAVLPGYRYIRTKATFHLADEAADQYITLERGKGILSLRFGVTHHLVESTREALFGPVAVRMRHTPRTISMYTANMGPHSRGWHLPYRVQWPVLGKDGLSLAIPEVSEFVEGIVLPYLQQHRNPESIRETYLLTPRRADFYLRSEQIVFAVDHLLGDAERLHADREVMLSRRGLPDDRRHIEEAFAIVLRASAA